MSRAAVGPPVRVTRHAMASGRDSSDHGASRHPEVVRDAWLPMTAHLLIGPVLRRVVGTTATVWVETTAPARVRVEAEGGGAGSAATFSAYGHHYAIVIVGGL